VRVKRISATLPAIATLVTGFGVTAFGADSGLPSDSSPGAFNSLAHNFGQLAATCWQDVLIFIGKVVAWGIGGCVALGILGFLFGLILYLILRRYGCFRMPFSWSKYVTWLWVPIFIFAPALGGAYAGFHLGAAHAVNTGFEKHRIIERSLSSLYCAIAFDAIKYNAEGGKSAREIHVALSQSEALGKVVSDDLGHVLRQCLDHPSVQSHVTPRQRSIVERVSNSRLGKATLDYAGKKDPALVVLAFYVVGANDQRATLFMEENPEATLALAAVTQYIARIRRECCSYVRGYAIIQSALGAGLGLGGPIVLLLLVRLALRLFRRPIPAKNV
jgi:hypothetical protein